jgi:dipeptidyl aminopeptidase/acylaminoacyl peptidase
MKRLLPALLAIALTFASATDAAKAPSDPARASAIEAFFKPDEFLDVRISPDGTYLAATILLTEDRGALAILRRSDMQLAGTFKLAGRDIVDSFVWANNTQLLLSIAESEGSRDSPSPMGEVIRVNFDGSDARMLAGGRAKGARDRSLVRKDAHLEWIFVMDALRDDDDNVLIYVVPLGGKQGTFPRIERMNIDSGHRDVLARSPVLNGAFLADEQQRVRFAWGENAEFEHSLFYRDDNAAEWRPVPYPPGLKTRQFALGMSADGTLAYLQVEQKSGPDELVSWNPKTNERKPLMKHASVDPAGLIYSTDGAHLLGVHYLDGLPSIGVVDSKHADIALLRSLAQAFPGEQVRIRNATADAGLVVFSVHSDRNPGEFYLHDRKTGKNGILMARRRWINPDKMSEVRPVQYQARDGQTIHGLLTVPAGSNGRNMPLIMNPHGGPIGVFDSWHFDPETQLLASQGYAVLQVNFRGSGNYGRAFLEQGFRQWGGLMIDDQTDAVRWAIKEGIADADRICIYGASYGAYAAMMGAARAPELYRCAVGYVGVYDLPKMLKDGDISDTRSGKTFLQKTMGSDPATLAAISPVKLADRIKAPVFLAAGALDGRALKSHSGALRRALKSAGNAPEWMLAPHEGHGFYRLEVNLEYYQRLLAFFDKHIGAGGR